MNIKKYDTQDIFKSLKSKVIGKISDKDIELIKTGFKRLKSQGKYNFNIKKGYVKIIYYNHNLSFNCLKNQQWYKLKLTLEKETPFIFGSIEDTYGKLNKQFFKYYRFYSKYNILELVSDYYEKIPIYYHFSSTGEYINNNGIDNISPV